MTKYLVTILRTTTSSAQVEVEADSDGQASELAINLVDDAEFDGHETTYEEIGVGKVKDDGKIYRDDS